MESYTAEKRSGEKLDYHIDWLEKNWLEPGETLTASTWIVTNSSTGEADSSVTESNDSNTDTVSTIFIAAGTKKETYKLECTVATNNSVSRTGVREIYLTILDK